MEVARSIDDEYDRSWALRAIVSELVRAGKFEKAMEVAKGIDNVTVRSRDLEIITFELAKAGKFEKALEVARGIDEFFRSDALREIVPELAKAGKFEKALEVARGIDELFGLNRSLALGAIASELAKAGKPYKHIFEEALEVARSMGDDEECASALGAIASGLANANEPYKHIFEEALEVARSMDYEWERTSALEKIAPELVDAGEFEKALEVVKSIGGEEDSNILREIAQGLAKIGKFEDALDAARSIDDEGDRSDALREIASELAKADEFEEALKVVKSSDDIEDCSNLLEEIAMGLLKVGKFEDALDAARGIDELFHSDALREIASELAKAGEFEKALEVIKSFDDTEDCSDLLKEIAMGFVKVGKFEGALEAARSINDEWDRLSALEEITPELVKASLWRNATEGAGSGSTPAPPSGIAPPPTTPTTHFTTLRTVWDPSSKDFVWGAEKPDEYGELPRIKEWLKNKNPNIYWFLLKIANHADHPVTEWNATLYTEQALTITEAHIDERPVRIVKSDFDTDSNRNVCVVSIPPELGVSIPANNGRRSMYFKMDIRCEDALKMEFGVSGVVKLGKSPQIEVPISEKRFTYACKYGDFRNMYYGSIDALASMAVTNLQDSYSREIVQNFTNSFRLIRDFENYCNDRYAESEVLIGKLEVVHSSLKTAEPITKDEILPLVGKNLDELRKLGDTVAPNVEAQKKRGIRMCEKLIELLHIATSNIK